VIFHVIADDKGELIAWIKAVPPTQTGPSVVIRPAHPTHVLHENLEIESHIGGRADLAAALKKALSNRIGHRK
jgi:hypothetical protein